MGMLDEVKTLLGSVSNVYIGSMPDTPDNSVALYYSGGYNPELIGTYVAEPTFMVKVRSKKYADGVTICEGIQRTLHGITHSGKFLLIAQQGDIQDLGRDGNGRQEWSLNFRTYYNRG